jgi:hypothetical protein
MHEVTQILASLECGNAVATERLFALVYDELRRLAAEMLGLPLRSAERLWTYGRAWLHRAIYNS